MSTIRELLVARAHDPNTALLFEGQRWSYIEYIQACADRAAYLLKNRREGPFHVGVLLDNVPEYPFWLGAAALAGATIVGINPTRRGAELARDITHTNCQLIVTDSSYRRTLDDLDLPLADDRILEVDSDLWRRSIHAFKGSALPSDEEVAVDSTHILLLIFTSGTSGAPKACICSQGRISTNGSILAQMMNLSEKDVLYCAMPLFHSNALITNWTPAIAVGGACVLRRKFSASGFLEDVRRYGVTYFNYVGKPLAYILLTPEQPNDAENTLVRGFGNEATEQDIERFQQRFGCTVTDAYGSTEGGVNVTRTADMPTGSLGRGLPGVVVLDAETGEECPPAIFDDRGQLQNSDDAIGELANKLGATGFEGYWQNEEAGAARIRNGILWSGDLAYRDQAGFLYFAGRNSEWLRVDGENFSAAPVERIISRHPVVRLAAVYAVPDVVVGDQVMAAIKLEPGQDFDAEAFGEFLSGQEDLGTKWMPRYLRICQSLPMTQTNKVLKRSLRSEFWECADPVWRRSEKGTDYRRLGPQDIEEIRHDFVERGREAALNGI
ncbi:MAG: long-chain-fatty-acid--CoA ligase [Myxococcota bacterium]